MNTELHDELPALFDSRILFLVTNLQTLFASEQMFHSETSKVYAELEAIVDKLATESQRGSYTLKKITGLFILYETNYIEIDSSTKCWQRFPKHVIAVQKNFEQKYIQVKFIHNCFLQ